MASPAERIEDLENFLRPYRRVSGPRFRSAPWLRCSFDEEVWIVHLDREFRLDWNVELDCGNLLTSSRHYPLWESFRSWLIAQTHVDVTGGRLQSVDTERNAIQRTLRCIDYFLLNSKELGVSSHHLSAITPNDLQAVISAIASSRSSSLAVYEWPRRLASFLRAQIDNLSQSDLSRLLQRLPALAEDVPESHCFLTDLSSAEAIRARAWLYENNLYTSSGKGFKLSPSTLRLAKLVYKNTVWGRNRSFPIPEELGIGRDHFFQIEFPRARVVGAACPQMSKQEVGQLIGTFRSLSLLRHHGLIVPDLPASVSVRDIESKNSKRYRTLPHSVVFSALRRAVEFVLGFGDSIVDSYVRLARSAWQAGLPIPVYARQHGISGFLDSKVVELGVKNWTIEPLDAGLPNRAERLSKSDYFAALRSNQGLYECIRVLYGAVAVVVGTLMARRHGELEDLIAGQCFDVSGTRLVFRNRKSGFKKLRKLEARPIPRIGAEAVRLLERLQAGLVDAGILSCRTNLFSYPKQYGDVPLVTISPRSGQYNESLDLFCDWAEVSLDRDGSRYYIRQHQLRRFFAMLFFWGGGYGGMDTLRWFLGHTDLEHLWHYITEFTPGATLRSVAAEWVAYGLTHASKEAEVLGAEISVHFGTTDFAVIEEVALIRYLEDLMEDGRLSVEPQFLDGGRAYRIAVLLDRKETPQ